MRRIAILLLFLAPKAFACSCIAGGTLTDALVRTPVVFTGVVESISDPDSAAFRALSREEQMSRHMTGSTPALHVKFRTMQVWRADSATTNTFELMTGFGGGDCGYPFQEGKAYVVFAFRANDGQLGTGICSKTAPLVCTDLEELGPPVKTYETVDRAHLIAREQPYKSYWMSCIKPAVLITDRNLTMNKHCRYEVDAIVDRAGNLSKFDVKRASLPNCPSIIDAVKSWKFEPATIDGVPVETRLNAVSLLEPMTKADYEKQLAEQKKWLEEHPRKKE